MRRVRVPARELARRQRALRVCGALGDTPDVRRRVARAFDVSERTLRRWAARQRAGVPLVRPRGRKPTSVPRARRQGVIAALLRLGPYAGVPALRGLFGDVPYRLLAGMKRRFVRALQRRRGWRRRQLQWRRAGAVWATDFTHPDASLPGDADRLLLVRDLASGAQLAAVPCRGERARPVCALLTALFLALGAPLVLKHDNGGAFRAAIAQELLAHHGVVSLCSPPYTPQYNGACERSGGVLKRRIAHAAQARGHPDRWSDQDLAEAQWLANATARPRGPRAPTPGEDFLARRPLTQHEREAFQRTRADAIAQATKTHKAKRGTMPSCSARAAIRRKATQHALCKLGYLRLRRGRISTPILTWKAVTKA